MYCRTCGNKMNDNAELCVKCGVRRNVGTYYCQVCGKPTLDTMTNCKSCGAKLMRGMSTNQMKTATVSAGKKTLGNVLLGLAIILLAVAIGCLIVGIMSFNSRSGMDLLSAAFRCGAVGAILATCGRTIKGKKTTKKK